MAEQQAWSLLTQGNKKRPPMRPTQEELIVQLKLKLESYKANPDPEPVYQKRKLLECIRAIQKLEQFRF